LVAAVWAGLKGINPVLAESYTERFEEEGFDIATRPAPA
jgi:hypothetical protein